MGEKIRTIGFIKYRNSDYEIEENESGMKKKENIIHIQNKKFRMEISESSYTLMSSLILSASKNLKKLKSL
jgi:hypothetical protein